MILRRNLESRFRNLEFRSGKYVVAAWRGGAWRGVAGRGVAWRGVVGGAWRGQQAGSQQPAPGRNVCFCVGSFLIGYS